MTRGNSFGSALKRPPGVKRAIKKLVTIIIIKAGQPLQGEGYGLSPEAHVATYSFSNFYEAIMVIALLKGTSVMTRIQTHTRAWVLSTRHAPLNRAIYF